MPYPVASGIPQLSGSAVPNVLWSTKLLIKFYAATVFGEIANTEYEGEIANHGDSVTIRTTPTVTVKDYVKGQDLDIERPEGTTIDLLIDKGKYWNFSADNVDVYQSDYDFVEDWTRDASEQLKIKIDTSILAAIYADAHASNAGNSAGKISTNLKMGASGSPLALDKSNILEHIVDINTVLDEQDVPESDRYCVLPAWACGLIKKSDLKDASLSGDDTSVIRNGKIGMIDNMMIYKSNLLARTVDGANTVTNIIAGQKSALTFASQLLENGVIDSERTFGKLFRGLQVYGYKVIKPEALVHSYAYQA